MARGFGYYIGRYSVVTLLPILVGGFIYADYTHTQEWKKRKALENGKVTLLS